MPLRRLSSLLLALCVLAAIILMTSPHAKPQPASVRLVSTDEHPKGRHRGRNQSDDSSGRQRRRRYRNQRPNNHTMFSDDDDEDEDGSVEVEVDFGDDENSRNRSPRMRDGISVPSLLSMQTLGLAQRQKNQRRRHDRHHKSRQEEDARSLKTDSEVGETTTRKERRPIKGSQKAVVVTQMTYLKKDWCKTQPLKQVVRMKGCLRTKILNNFCYGQCNSFYIPKKARKDKDTEAFLSCGFCRPRRIRWILVTLRCPGPSGLRFKRKRVQYVKKCRCMAQDVSMPPVS